MDRASWSVIASNRIVRTLESGLITRGVDQVLHQSQHRHRTGPARILGDPARDLFDRLEIDVAAELARTDATKSLIPYTCIGFDYIGGDKKWPADAGSDARNHQVGPSANSLNIFGMAM